MDKIPVYKAILTDEIDGISAISIVENPAMEVEWKLFNEEIKEKQLFNYSDEEMIITYPLIVANKPIYRNIPFDHYIVFDKSTIKEIAMRFHNKGINNFNENHTNKEIKDKMYIFESWIKGKIDKSNEFGFEEVEEGSLMVSIQVTDKEYWNNVVKKGEFRGLSMEIFYEMYSEEFSLINFTKNLLKSNLDDDVLIKTLQNYLKNN